MKFIDFPAGAVVPTLFLKVFRAATLSATIFLAGPIYAGPPSAANLVANGDFSQNNFAGWASFGDTSSDFSSGQAAVFGAWPQPGGIRQVLKTDAGKRYEIGLRVGNDEPGKNSLAVYWEGKRVLAQKNLPAFPAKAFKVDVTAHSAASELRLEFTHESGTFEVDDITVVPIGDPSKR